MVRGGGAPCRAGGLRDPEGRRGHVPSPGPAGLILQPKWCPLSFPSRHFHCFHLPRPTACPRPAQSSGKSHGVGTLPSREQARQKSFRGVRQPPSPARARKGRPSPAPRPRPVWVPAPAPGGRRLGSRSSAVGTPGTAPGRAKGGLVVSHVTLLLEMLVLHKRRNRDSASKRRPNSALRSWLCRC